jgi:hypothetical protein
LYPSLTLTKRLHLVVQDDIDLYKKTFKTRQRTIRQTYFFCKWCQKMFDNKDILQHAHVKSVQNSIENASKVMDSLLKHQK